ncbi:MAG TPA: DMT family transporter [Nitrospirota bacterium]
MMNLRLLFVAVIWGVNFSVVKFALTDFHPLGFTVVRFSLAALFLFSMMLARREPFTIFRHDRLSLAVLGLLGIALYNIFFMYGLQYTTAANSALLISLSPLFGALIQAASGRERLTMNAGFGLALASAGVYLIIKGRHGAMSLTSSGIIGDLLTLCATFTWALYTILAKPLLARYTPLKVTAYSMAAGSLLLLPVSLPGLLNQPWRAVAPISWAALGYAAFIAAGVAYSLWYQGVKQIGVTRTMVYHYLMPFAAVLFAATALHERITLFQIAGGAAILAGISLVQTPIRRI